MARPKGSPQKGGRKGTSKYNSEKHDQLIVVMARYGARDVEIAAELGIAKSTYYEWKKANPGLAAMVRAAKFEYDSDNIEKVLVKSATGYDYTETTKELIKDPKVKDAGNDSKAELKLIVTKTVKKHVSPNITAIIFWLKNRRKADWQDAQKLDIGGLESLAESIRKGRERAAARA
ncbi:MAG: transposase [Syntrophobacteraceae bacterium]